MDRGRPAGLNPPGLRASSGSEIVIRRVELDGHRRMIGLAQKGNGLFPLSEWVSVSFRDGHLTHPDLAADGGPPHAQNGGSRG